MVKICSIFIFASMALVGAETAPKEGVTNHDQPALNFRQELLKTINDARAAKGLKDLCTNKKLMNAAQIQANYLVEKDLITSMGESESTPEMRAVKAGFNAKKVTEIVGGGFSTAFDVVAQWANAKSVKETLFSNHNVMGFGYAFDKAKKKYMHYWVVDFSDGECGDGDATNSEERISTVEKSENTKEPLTFDGLKTLPPKAGKTPLDGAKVPSDGELTNCTR
ncbi:unnamed protein product [Peronospora effusa]|nr:unnamed protein product [Peronospora effusa]